MARSKRPRISKDALPENNVDEINVISCETCRQRKCKCDRKLPYCSQCSNDPSTCVYPESGKRGLPLGYLNQLEQRLSETEAALYGALATLHAIRPAGTIVQASTKHEADQHKTKSMRMEEWSKLPLQAWPDMGQWMNTVSDQFAVNSVPASMFHGPRMASDEVTTERQHRGHESTDAAAQVPRSTPTWHHQDEIMARNSKHESFVRPQIIGPSGGNSRDAATRNSDSVASLHGSGAMNMETGNEGPKSKAEELSKEKCNIYF